MDPHHQAATRVLDSLPDAVVALELETLTVVHLNPAAEALFGWSSEELTGRSSIELLHPDDVPLALAGLDWVGDHDRGSLIELRIQGVDGEKLVELAGGRHESPDGDLLFLTMRDLTDRRRWEIAHDDAAAFRALVHHSGSLLAHLDTEGTILAASSALTRDLGHDQAHVIGSAFEDLVHVEDRLAASEALRKVAAGAADSRMTVEARLCKVGARSAPYQLQFATLEGDPTVDGLVVSAHDISALDQARRELAHAASHDPLTGLLNRAGFMERLTTDMEVSRHRLTVAFVDLNGFKPVNDQFGHAMGDRLLHIVAGRLAAAIREEDYAARLGGDEFALALHAVEPMFVARIVERLANAIAEPAVLATDTVSVSASIGTAPCSRYPNADRVLAAADAAMYEHKSSRRR